MKKQKYVFFKGKWRVLHSEKVGGKNIPKDSRRNTVSYYVLWKGGHHKLTDAVLNTLEQKYDD